MKVHIEIFDLKIPPPPEKKSFGVKNINLYSQNKDIFQEIKYTVLLYAVN